jgi:hypothetical protein
VATISGYTVARIDGGANGQGFGGSIAFLGNFDGTGGGDFAVGTSGTTGDAYVINGGTAAAIGTRSIAAPDVTNVLQLDGPTLSAAGTVVVSALGNINGTGGDDLGVGIAGANAAYVVYGKNSQGGTSLGVVDSGLSYDSLPSVDAILNHYAGAGDKSSEALGGALDVGIALPYSMQDHMITADMA